MSFTSRTAVLTGRNGAFTRRGALGSLTRSTGGVPAPPDGYVYLLGADGAYLTGADGAYLLGAA